MFSVILVSKDWKGKTTLTNKGRFPTKQLADARKASLLAHAKRCKLDRPTYNVVDVDGHYRLQKKVDAQSAVNRKAGAAQAAATRRENGTKPSFVLCPHCKSKSKKLFSEMGGLQTRQCRRGHQFTYDKWIADRAATAFIFTGRLPNPYV
jgi:glutaredoxin